MTDYLKHHEVSADRYEGFNLLLFNLNARNQPQVGYLTNRPMPTRLDLSASLSTPTDPDGNRIVETHGLSNTPLKEPFFKVTEGQTRMGQALKSWSDNDESEEELIERLMVDLLS